MKYGVAFFPSKEIQDLANSYRMRYDTHYSWIPPHITLRYPFEASESIEETITNIQEIAAAAAPFPMTIYKADTFHPKENKIFFKIKPNETLMNLYSALNDEPKTSLGKQHEFTPHLTIAQDLTDDEHFDVLGRLQMKDIHHEEIIDRIQLLYQLDNGSWTVYETFRLGKEV
ncbi:2'-5' RNA ligase family protein [Alteribacillus sp. HJP-4]|uniref:2'-5' RNA ligase family protein n=1 Tax=Alteribacillus sp. HJP-4 TaxID=2775394 RepID=UPI0035CD121C